jgi:hypothetical protein
MEQYVYHIEIPENNKNEEETIRTISRKGIATSILKKKMENGKFTKHKKN